MKQELVNLQEYFDTLFKGIDDNIILDEEQRTAILKEEENTMIIAGAGSGKTTTMAAKVKYLVDIKKVNPKHIVMISFTNKAVEELKTRIQIELHVPCLIYTFHKFGLSLFETKKKIMADSYSFVLEFFEENLSKNKNLLKKFNHDFPTYFSLPKGWYLCKNLDQYYQYKKKYRNLFSKKTEAKDSYYQSFIQLCLQFIQKIKSKNKRIEEIVPRSKKEVIFVQFIHQLYNFYQTKLEQTNSIDFDDIIIKATEQIKNKVLPYQYIIVDEYQDISYQRFLFIKRVCEVSKAKLIVVGDDFQTIYSFSGSQIELFTNFKQLVGKCNILKITNTYRNSQQLIDVAGNFVMRNRCQIKKQLLSYKTLSQPITIVFYRDLNRIQKLYFCIQDIIKKYGENEKILLLGRYHFDIHPYLGKQMKLIRNRIYISCFPTLNITFLSVHSAKGLGFDQVIIINGNGGLHGFPSQVINHPIMELIEKEENSLLEERRLFYVALTRTKNKVYILTDRKNPSSFVLEIMNEKEVIVIK